MRHALTLLLLLVSWSIGAAAQVPVATLTGTVRDSLRQPVRDAVVVLDFETLSLRTRTDTGGRFRIERVPVGRRQLQVVRIGYRPHRSSIDVTEAGTDVAVTIERVTRVLDTVSVRVARTGIHGVVSTTGMSLLPHAPRPLRGAIVEVLDTPHRTTTGADGHFSIPTVAEGAWSLLVRLDRYQSRVYSTYVPETGGVDVDIVLDSTIADWQRREDNNLREISFRIRRANNPAAFVSAAELVGPEGATLHDVLREAPSALSRGLLVRDDVTCVYVDGIPRPRMTAKDFLADDVHAVEVYGIDGRYFAMEPGQSGTPVTGSSVRWLPGTFCGTGPREGPNWRPPGERPRLDNLARTLVVWLKKGRS